MNGSVLSNRDIERYYGKKIFIYPYSLDNMRGGSSYNLTASQFAYFSDKTGVHYAVENGVIKVPPHTTVLIQTEESIFVSDNICGTYHSKVKLVSDGLSHIATTLDPKYFGTSKIAVQNTTNQEKTIDVGSTFVSLMFYKMKRKATARHDNGPGRNDVIPVNIDKLEIDNEQKQVLKSWFDKDWRRNCDSLIDICKSTKDKTELGHKIKFLKKLSLILEIIFVTIPLLLLFIHFLIVKIPFIDTIFSKSEYISIAVSIVIAINPIKNGIIKLLENNIRGNY